MAKRRESEGAARPVAVRARGEPAFVLSTHPWRETSLIAELLTRNYGRVTVVVRGAKRVSSRFRGLVNPFVPLLVSFSGQGDIKNLTDARWLGGLAPIEPESLVSAFYVNELVLRLTARADACPELFEAYVGILADLALKRGRELSAALRRFEIKLLAFQGWSQAGKSEEIKEGGMWTVCGGELVRVREQTEAHICVSAESALAVASGRIPRSADLREVRDVLRLIIGYYVGERGLKTRKTVESWTQF